MKHVTIRPKRGATRKSAHAVLVNKKTDKVSSSSDWLNVERAKAFDNGEIFGLPALMVPRGLKLLIHNKLINKKMRSPAAGHVNQQVRDQAKGFIIVLTVLYEKHMKSQKPLRRKDFATWIANEMTDVHSEAVLRATALGFDELVDAQRSIRWWYDLLKKMQS